MRSVKALCALGIIISSPLFLFLEWIEKAPDCDYENYNTAMIYSASISIFYGFGLGLTDLGVYTYIGLNTKPEHCGKAYSILFMALIIGLENF